MDGTLEEMGTKLLATKSQCLSNENNHLVWRLLHGSIILEWTWGGVKWRWGKNDGGFETTTEKWIRNWSIWQVFVNYIQNCLKLNSNAKLGTDNSTISNSN